MNEIIVRVGKYYFYLVIILNFNFQFSKLINISLNYHFLKLGVNK